MCLDLNKVVESLQADLAAASSTRGTSTSSTSDRTRELEREIARLQEQLARERSTWGSQASSSGRWPNAEDARVSISFLFKQEVR